MSILPKAGWLYFLHPFYRYVFFLLIISLIINAQTSSAQGIGLSIREAVEKVQNNLPQLEAFRRQASASQQKIELAKNTIVPELNVGYQVNMATFNNITGMSYPGFLVPISGPPSVGNDLNFVPGVSSRCVNKMEPAYFWTKSCCHRKGRCTICAGQFCVQRAVVSIPICRY